MSSLLPESNPNYSDSYGYDDSDTDKSESSYRPTIVIMGQKRSGKTSIRKVVFQKMSPNETLFVESTARVTDEPVTGSFINLKTIEFPGQVDPFEASLNPKTIFAQCGALLFVIDAQADMFEALKKMTNAIVRAYGINNNIKFEVFIHKVDGLSEETRMGTFRRIFQKVQDDLADNQLESVHINYHMTSIYDHSIFEAFSKVIQKLVKQLPALIKLLDLFNSASNVEKSFLFDVSSKIYIATDSQPVDMPIYELCCDMIDVCTDLAAIYGGIPSADEPPKDGYDLDSQAVVRLRINQVLFMKQINRYLALVAVVKKENFEKEGLIDYNFNVFKKSVSDVFEVGKQANDVFDAGA
jgi:Ras-related GTP-binding protein C/D